MPRRDGWIEYLDEGLPQWDESGTFRYAWRGSRWLSDCADGGLTKNAPEYLRNAGAATRTLLEVAHVCTLSVDQFKALPTDLSDLREFKPDPNLPFNVLYVSVDHEEFAGVMIAKGQDDQVTIVAFWQFEPEESEHIALPMLVIDAERHTYRNIMAMIMGHDWDDDLDEGVMVKSLAGDALKVVRFLESANVDIDDTPVSRQVRRNAARKRLRIAQTVTVRKSQRRRREGQAPSGDHIEFSHRFEVRGHYKHFGENTQLFKAWDRENPDKIINHPERGRIVRIYCPPFVKGPENKPLVPKVRKYGKERQDVSHQETYDA